VGRERRHCSDGRRHGRGPVMGLRGVGRLISW
jgi:hypothetical protein